MKSLSPIASDIAKLILLLSSDKPGEVNATALAIGRKLKAGGCDWHDLAAAICDNQKQPKKITLKEMAESLVAIDDTLLPKQRLFVREMAVYTAVGRRISPKQEKYLRGLFEKYVDAHDGKRAES